MQMTILLRVNSNVIMTKKLYQIVRELKYGENSNTRVNVRNGLQFLQKFFKGSELIKYPEIFSPSNVKRYELAILKSGYFIYFGRLVIFRV